MKLWERTTEFSLQTAPIQGVADDQFLLFLFHPPQPPHCSHSLPLRLWLRQHLSVPPGQKLRLRLRLQRTLPLREWASPPRASSIQSPLQPEAPAPPAMASPAAPSPAPTPDPAPVLVFDGGCPFCRHFAAVSELRSGIAGLTIVDGRADGPLRQSLAARGYHLRDGAMVLVGDRVLHGAGAVAWLCAQMQPSPGLLQLLAAVLADPARSRTTYPLLLAARRFALGLKRLPIDPDLS